MDAYRKKSKEPHIEVIDITKTEDGVPDMLFEVNDAFLDMIKTEKNIDNKQLADFYGQYIEEGLDINSIEEEFKYRTLPDNIQENKYKYANEFNKDTYINDFNKSKHIFMNYDLSYIDLALFKPFVKSSNHQSEVIDYLLTYTKLSYKQIINRLKNITKELSKQ